ncbi:dienelactone hydrolase family protein [Burkholderia sp. Ac-20353]|uniref:dienelactone hydrolase family protein n=1 Tax=Burkholderia sp. Ac-20353 TaxID=2703894 RepID=UPI00197B9A06|nr:dienelactone hydrolase family protein [Burkholderia sp. Ac-20353]MBN3785351.1 dienelactone hydrolase [Burkholderia sp. Ac-20353]
MSHWITMATTHGPMNGWLAQPDDRPVGGIVVVHEMFGVNTDMCRFADRYAADGYLTVVPALFDNIRREVELDYAPGDHQLGNELTLQLGFETATELVATAADAIGHAGDIAIIGYGWGGKIALHAAQTLSTPCVIYCGACDPSRLAEAVKIPTLVHCSEFDPQFSSEEWRTFERDSPGSLVRSYPAGHAFHREGDPLHYHPESASRAFDRTRIFLREHVHGVCD